MPRLRVISPEGVQGFIPIEDLETARKEGFRIVGPEMPSAAMPIEGDSIPRQMARGVVKSGMSTGTGLLDMVGTATGADPNAPGISQLREFSEPAEGAESYTKTGTDIAQFLIPGMLAARAGKAVKVGEMVKQGRGPAGQFLKAIRSPRTSDIVKQAAVRGATEVGATGVLNKAQGGDFTTGAMAGAGGAAVRGIAPPLTRVGGRLMDAAVENPIVRNTLLPGLGVGGAYAYHTGRIGNDELLKASMLAAFASPTLRQAALKTVPATSRILTGAGLQLNRKRKKRPITVDNIADAEPHINKGY